MRKSGVQDCDRATFATRREAIRAASSAHRLARGKEKTMQHICLSSDQGAASIAEYETLPEYSVETAGLYQVLRFFLSFEIALTGSMEKCSEADP
jgi:hypothetical protein